MKNNTNIEYGGKCAFSLSLGKIPTTTQEKHTLTKNGRTFSFLNPVAKLLFRILPNSIEKADKAWENQ